MKQAKNLFRPVALIVSALFLLLRSSASADETVVFTETFIDTPLPIVAVSINMTSGEIVKDDIPGPFMGTRFEGTFEIIANLADGTAVATPLNTIMNPQYPNEPLIFLEGEWSLQFADFTGDGRLETNLGQHAGSNGNLYRVIGFLPSGEALEMPFMDMPRGIFVSDHNYSSEEIRATGSGEICFEWYDNTRGITVLERWKWDPLIKFFTRVGKEEKI